MLFLGLVTGMSSDKLRNNMNFFPTNFLRPVTIHNLTSVSGVRATVAQASTTTTPTTTTIKYNVG